MPEISVLQRQEDCKCGTSLSYIIIPNQIITETSRVCLLLVNGSFPALEPGTFHFPTHRDCLRPRQGMTSTNNEWDGGSAAWPSLEPTFRGKTSEGVRSLVCRTLVSLLYVLDEYKQAISSFDLLQNIKGLISFYRSSGQQTCLVSLYRSSSESRNQFQSLSHTHKMHIHTPTHTHSPLPLPCRTAVGNAS